MPKLFPLARRMQPLVAASLIAIGLLVAARSGAHDGPLPISLKGVPVPEVPGLLDGSDPIIINKNKALVLGKALFWDINAGSDGQACASCHFHAGADRRSKNQFAPVGQSGKLAAAAFDAAPDNHPRGPNYTLKLSDFPLIQPNDPLRPPAETGFRRKTDNVVGSAGTFGGTFKTVELMHASADDCMRTPDATFSKGGIGARRVTQRNAPTVINAVFNHRSFWDGRANNVFNGSSAWGDRDPNAGVWIKNPDGSLVKQRLRLINSSLASQALAPPVNTTEMGCAGRSLADLGRKLMWRRPLENQNVHGSDSVLGSYAFSTAGTLKPGLNTYYVTLVRQAFNQKYWSSTARGPFGAPKANSPEEVPSPYNQYEANFGMFFALAIQLYESTLVSDDSPFDRSARDGDGLPIDLSASQLRGLTEFRNAHCNQCHMGPTFSSAAIVPIARLQQANPNVFGLGLQTSTTGNVVDRAATKKGIGLTDVGFASTGVTDDAADVGLSAKDDFGNPLSFAEQFQRYLAGRSSSAVDAVVKNVRPCDFGVPLARNVPLASSLYFTQVDGIAAQTQATDGCFNLASAYTPSQAAAAAELAKTNPARMLVAVDGSFKIPTLRNVELTGPYMHNGGMATLDEVLEFYTRGGNFEGQSKKINFVFPTTELADSASLRADVVEFLKSLTDDRVRYERAPFDHPELPVLHGHKGDHVNLLGSNPLGRYLGTDEYLLIPAVGASGLIQPLKSFDAYLEN